MPKQRSLAVRLKEAKDRAGVLDFEKRIKDLADKKRQLRERMGRRIR